MSTSGSERRSKANTDSCFPASSSSCVFLGNEMFAKEIQAPGTSMQRCRSKFHADDHVRSNFGFSLDESMRANDSIILRGESELQRDVICETRFSFSSRISKLAVKTI